MDEGRVVQKVWGWELYVTNRDEYAGKILYVKSGFKCSLHRHRLKDETFHVLAGGGVVQLDGKLHCALPGDTFPVPPGCIHLFAAAHSPINMWTKIGMHYGMVLMEVSTRHRDEDVDRLSESSYICPKEDEELWEALKWAMK